LTCPEQVASAMEGCDVVVHCAYGASGMPVENRQVTVDGTRILADAAVAQGVRRFIHISSVAVYSYTPPPNVTESTPLVQSRDEYCRDKVEAENIIWEQVHRRGLPGVVLRMGNIYGPFSGPWTIRPLQHIRDGIVCLVDEGSHDGNMVFVDNAVEAILLAIREDCAVGQAFFITDDPVNWQDFYGYYARWLGESKLSSIPQKIVDQYVHPTWGARLMSTCRASWAEVLLPTVRFGLLQAVLSPSLGKWVSKMAAPFSSEFKARLLGKQANIMQDQEQPAPMCLPLPLPQPGLLEVYAGRTRFSNDKAKEILGFGPHCPLEEAMSITEQWARWARLI
ncbi:MAG: NAD(P)-dependent oxidoreductase, partial [Deltaproteobacteria bacterium]|nr:NAD(P)-dependent oxidoreductase [Deltaproteobacteria bacterium]